MIKTRNRLGIGSVTAQSEARYYVPRCLVGPLVNALAMIDRYLAIQYRGKGAQRGMIDIIPVAHRTDV